MFAVGVIVGVFNVVCGIIVGIVGLGVVFVDV